MTIFSLFARLFECYVKLMIDREGLEDLNQVVLDAIEAGLAKDDPNIHPDLNGLRHPIAKTAEKDPSWVGKIRQKLLELQSKDGNIYPLF